MLRSASSDFTNNESGLVNTLAALSEIGARITRLGMGHDLPITLRLIAENAVDVITDPASPDSRPSAVIWIYDEARHVFEPGSRVAAGEPEGASTDDFPRPDGLGQRALLHRRRLLSYEESGQTIHPAKLAAGARAMACYPLIVAREVVGVLYVYRCDQRPFSPIELLLLDNFVNMAAMAIYHGRQVGGMARALTQKVRELEQLGLAARLISSRSNLDETLREILSIGLDLVAAQYGSLELYDKKNKRLEIKALAGRGQSLAGVPSLPVNDDSVVGRVASRRQSLLIPDLLDPSWQVIYQPLPADREMRSEVAVPLIGTGGGLEGVLNIESPLPNAFTADDQRVLEALAVQAAAAIQEIRLLDALQEIIEALLAVDIDELLKLIVDRACELINVPVGSIWLLSGADSLVLRQSTSGYRRSNQLSLDHSLTGQAVRLRQPLTIDDVRTHPDFLDKQLAIEQGWVSAIIVPLVVPGRPGRALGGFSLYSDHLRDFSDRDKKLLTCLANHAAVAIRAAEQLVQLKQAQERQAVAETFAAIGDTAANLLHQLNNKVGVISVRVQGVEDKCPDIVAASPYLAHNLHEIEQAARQAMAIVRDSFNLLRPAGRQFVDLGRCLERALDRAAFPAGIEVFKTGLEGLPRVMASELQLEMVFYNLLDNAAKAMAGQGQLRISGEQRDQGVAVTVADSGPGIPSELQARIFDFSPMSAAEPANQLGFGLWWVKTFVDRFGGRLFVESEPGQGCAFTIWLPVSSQESQEWPNG